ncbi:hypothetical protein ACFQ1E_11950 [Sphingomonas canadensis]|uniref:Uncharacterized protein n=1 Tax=Sphingomonas canadensis TaxID=1219257 RepID=A0ABW3H6I0_9SPHN|nr:hypothetical protein [Sphingomonas canadensis]MCW3836813.1 hypothetical protein [Sphingomonas canadensis]
MSGREAATGMGSVIGVAVVLIAPIAIGYWWSRRLTARREGYDPVRWPIAVGFVVSLLMLAGQCAKPQSPSSGKEVVTTNG